MTETCRYFDSEEWNERLKRHGDDDIPEDCPHDVEEDGLCIFHLPVDKKDDKKTKEEFLKKVQEGGEEAKYFVGAKFGELNLAYEILESEDDNHPIDLRFAGMKKLDMNNARVDQEWRMDHSIIIGESDFKDVDFRGSSHFTGAEFKKNCVFTHAEFGSYSDFTKARFKGESNFMGTDFEWMSDFTGVIFEGDSNFGHTKFEGLSYFTHAEFENESHFGSAEFKEDIDFDNVVFQGQSKFKNVKFEQDAFFREARFKEEVDFTKTRFRSWSDFSGAELEGKSDFKYTEFASISFPYDVDFKGDTKFNNAEFGYYTDFSNAKFAGDADFGGAVFGRITNFVDTEFRKESEFTGTKFGRVADFSSVEFGGSAEFNIAEFEGSSIFSNAEFSEEASFGESTLGGVSFEETVASVIELEDATIQEGEIQQPEDGSAFYDLTGATFCDVTIRAENSNHDLFDHFKFYRTDFDGFDFTEYKEDLLSNSRIHEFVPDDESEGEDDQIDELEATYLKAKDGAKKVGDHELASKFFIKEMQYRREKYKDEIENEDLDWKHRAKLEFDRGINWLYEKTSGYGEKPIRVILTSLSVVVLFTFLYPIVGIRQTGDGAARLLSYASASAPAEYLDVIAHSFYFSSVTFTTLGYGDMYPVGLSRILSTVQSATGALLIALLIFVFGRSVKW
ncbi:MAG: pentapeptide repeat-containing protein [Halobacteriales archaeon]|nr:pentapeptide repeat-containing protein [Halobacteriales archaeon]